MCIDEPLNTDTESDTEYDPCDTEIDSESDSCDSDSEQ